MARMLPLRFEMNVLVCSSRDVFDASISLTPPWQISLPPPRGRESDRDRDVRERDRARDRDRERDRPRYIEREDRSAL